MPRPVLEQVDTFFRQYPTKTFDQGALLLFPDSSVPSVSYLVTGLVGQYDISEAGNKTMLTVFKPGAFFPMSSAVNNKPTAYFFEALEQAEVRQAPAAAVVAFVRREPDVLFNLLQRLYSGTDGLLSRMSLLMSGTAQSRLRFEILLAAERFGKPQADGSYLVVMTEAQLASQTGLARETVSRELQKCAKQGVVKLERGAIYVNMPA